MSRLSKKNWWYQEDLIEKAVSEQNCKELGLPISKYKHISVHDGEGTLVAYCGCHEKTLVNAKLITAAPNMKVTIEGNITFFQNLKKLFSDSNSPAQKEMLRVIDKIVELNKNTIAEPKEIK